MIGRFRCRMPASDLSHMMPKFGPCLQPAISSAGAMAQSKAWGAGPGAPFIWVIVAMPNASVPLNIPGVAFGAEGLPVAGLTREVRGYMIVVNGKMAPESSLSSFLHEFGHATYMRTHPNGAEAVAAEMALTSR